MRHVLKASLVIGVLAAMLPATAQVEGPPVPVDKAAYHWPIFRNEYVMLLRVYMAPGKGSNYHIHSLDQISVLIEGTGNAGQVFGKEVSQPKDVVKDRGGSVGFTAYSKKGPFTHRSTNVGKIPFNNLVVGLLKPQPGNFQPEAREGAGYTQIFDNERARAWRLRLDPGQSAAPVNQTGPGMRIIFSGDDLTEIVEGQMDRGLALRSGDFYWQDPGTRRVVRNTGTTPLHLTEFELK